MTKVQLWSMVDGKYRRFDGCAEASRAFGFCSDNLRNSLKFAKGQWIEYRGVVLWLCDPAIATKREKKKAVKVWKRGDPLLVGHCTMQSGVWK